MEEAKDSEKEAAIEAKHLTMIGTVKASNTIKSIRMTKDKAGQRAKVDENEAIEAADLNIYIVENLNEIRSDA